MTIRCSSIENPEWKQLPEFPNHGISVFRIQLSTTKLAVSSLHALLQEAESLRANSYYKETDGYQFLVARAALRILLGKYTNQPPSQVRFAAGLNNKPILYNTPDLHFNVSHSGDYIIIAISTKEIGVDIEKINPNFYFQDVLDHSFSLIERSFLENHSGGRQLFYQSWTRKEAFVKATAQGINADFHRVPSLDGVHFLPSETVAACWDWTINSFAVTPDYAAAVAFASNEFQAGITFYSLSSSWFTDFCAPG